MRFYPFTSFPRRQSGNVLIEFALVLPLLVFVFSGMVELTYFALTQNKLDRAASVITDLIARQNISRDTLQAYVETIPKAIEPLSFVSGSVVVSQIRNDGETDNPANMEISWQESFQGGVSRFGNVGDTPSNLPNDIEILLNQTLIVTEVFYTYTPLFFTSFMDPQEIYKIAAFVPRLGTMNVLLGEGG